MTNTDIFKKIYRIQKEFTYLNKKNTLIQIQKITSEIDNTEFPLTFIDLNFFIAYLDPKSTSLDYVTYSYMTKFFESIKGKTYKYNLVVADFFKDYISESITERYALLMYNRKNIIECYRFLRLQMHIGDQECHRFFYAIQKVNNLIQGSIWNNIHLYVSKQTSKMLDNVSILKYVSMYNPDTCVLKSSIGISIAEYVNNYILTYSKTLKKSYFTNLSMKKFLQTTSMEIFLEFCLEKDFNEILGDFATNKIFENKFMGSLDEYINYHKKPTMYYSIAGKCSEKVYYIIATNILISNCIENFSDKNSHITAMDFISNGATILKRNKYLFLHINVCMAVTNVSDAKAKNILSIYKNLICRSSTPTEKQEICDKIGNMINLSIKVDMKDAPIILSDLKKKLISDNGDNPFYTLGLISMAIARRPMELMLAVSYFKHTHAKYIKTLNYSDSLGSVLLADILLHLNQLKLADDVFSILYKNGHDDLNYMNSVVENINDCEGYLWSYALRGYFPAYSLLSKLYSKNPMKEILKNHAINETNKYFDLMLEKNKKKSNDFLSMMDFLDINNDKGDDILSTYGPNQEMFHHYMNAIKRYNVKKVNVVIKYYPKEFFLMLIEECAKGNILWRYYLQRLLQNHDGASNFSIFLKMYENIAKNTECFCCMESLDNNSIILNCGHGTCGISCMTVHLMNFASIRHKDLFGEKNISILKLCPICESVA